MKNRMKCIIYYMRWFCHNTKTINSAKYNEKRMQYGLVKKSHSIEKGFCLKDVRQGFGVEKIKNLLQDINIYIDKGYDATADGFQICCGILKYYFEEWQELDCRSPIHELKEEFECILEKNKILLKDIYRGGVEKRNKDINENNNYENLKIILKNRDSVRNFANGTVDIDKVEEAIKLAQTAPSACNRQPSRVYIVEREKYHLIEKWMRGVGSFLEDADKWIIITSDVAAFGRNELGQYIVSGSIFAGYLILILRTMGFAACMIQRNILFMPKKLRKSLGISGSEQAICVIAVGNMQGEYLVPRACRYSVENIIKRV